ncbi:MAG: hypothetical protein FWG51_05030 [Firmicutes bacterium]|nr:hypothetical protein [Bacillota bacterium]
MFYKKKPALNSKKRYRIKFTDFSGGLNTLVDKNLLSQKYAVNTYNIDYKDRTLKTGMGICKLKFQIKDLTAADRESDTVLKETEFDPIALPIKKLIYFKRFDRDKLVDDDRLLIVTENGSLYSANITDLTQFSLIDGVHFNAAPNFVCYRLNGDDVVIMTSESDDMIIWDGVNPPYSVPDAPKITSMCVHYERLFVTVGGDKSAVWFSDDLDPSNWAVNLNEAGFIEIADSLGGLLKVVRFIDYVYIFRSYAIARLTAYGDQTQFTLNQLFTTSGRIFPDTVQVCGDRILFLAEDGLYMFDGLQTYKILKNIEGLFLKCDKSKCVAAFSGGCYYLTLNDDSDYGYVLKYNISDNSIDIYYGPQIIDILPICAEGYTKIALIKKDDGNVYTFDKSGCFLNEPLKKLWITPITDLNYPELDKCIRKLMVNTKHDILITIVSDVEKKSYVIKGKDGISITDICVFGKYFSMEIKSETKDIYVAKPEILVDI